MLLNFMYAWLINAVNIKSVKCGVNRNLDTKRQRISHICVEVRHVQPTVTGLKRFGGSLSETREQRVRM